MHIEMDDLAAPTLRGRQPPGPAPSNPGRCAQGLAPTCDLRPAAAPPADAVVFFIDSDAQVRAALRELEACADWRLETLRCASEFLDRPSHGGPSCVVFDVNLQPGGLELQSHIATLRVDTPIIFTTGCVDVPMVVQGMKAGAVDFLTKPVLPELLLAAIETSLARSRAALDRATKLQSVQARYAQLSRREQEVMALVVAGLLNKQIGSELGISEITVKAHRGSVMRKMNVRTLPELVRLALRMKLPA